MECILPQAHYVTSDASGSWGCGAVNDSAHWFQVKWPQAWDQYHISMKEMVPVVIAIAIWGQLWQSSTVQRFSDNMSVVWALSAVKAPLLLHLLRCLRFFTAQYQICVEADHIAGVTLQALTTLLQMHYLATGFIMLWAPCCLGLFGFTRAGEFTVTSTSVFDPLSSLCASDVSLDNQQNPFMVHIVLR